MSAPSNTHKPNSILFPLTALQLAAGLALLGCGQTPPVPSAPAEARPQEQASTLASNDLLVYVGTYAQQPSSVYLCRLNPTTGALTLVGSYNGGASPSYLTLDPARRFLYAVSEVGTFQGRANSGGVSALAINASTGALTLQNQQPSMGASPCYISLDQTGQNALVANYTGGSVSMLPVQTNGQLGAPSATDQHRPPVGPHPNQSTPHAHCLLPDPANRFAFSADLGTDKVYGYRLNATQHSWQPLSAPAFTARAGAGPRHLTFHPNGRFAYLVNELNSTVTALSYDATAGSFRELNTLSTLPAGFTGTNSGADVHVSPDGKFLYTSNRGRNSIAVFAIGSDGRLRTVQDVSTQGQTPRNFALTPNGQLLLVANQNSSNIFSYRVDLSTGKLTATGQRINVPTPVCLSIVSDFTK